MTKRRGRTRESPHVLVFRVFYEAARDLDSQPPLRNDHVEACRPRGVLPHPVYRPARRSPRGRVLRTMSAGERLNERDAVPSHLGCSRPRRLREESPWLQSGGPRNPWASLSAARFRVEGQLRMAPPRRSRAPGTMKPHPPGKSRRERARTGWAGGFSPSLWADADDRAPRAAFLAPVRPRPLRTA